LFNQDGTSKLDCANIMTQSNSFYEGLVIDVYEKLLSRLPSSTEMGENTTYVKSNSYALLQRKILITKEYAGF
jgi:hypothetical protein